MNQINKKYNLYFWSIILLLLLQTPSFASKALESSDFSLLKTEAKKLAERYGIEHVLIGYDIDNTLLDLNQDLGSDQWFNWQMSLLPEHGQPAKPNALGNSIVDILAPIPAIYALTGAHPTEPNEPAIVKGLQDEGFKSVVITARGTDCRDATLKQLRTSGYDFSRNPIQMKQTEASTYLPYDLNSLYESGLTVQDVQDSSSQTLRKPNPVTYSDGVLLTGGQNKGVMTKAFIHRAHAEIKAILFIDDTAKNDVNMQDAFKKTSMDVITIRYSYDDDKVKKFKSGDHAQAIQQWKNFQELNKQVFSHP